MEWISFLLCKRLPIVQYGNGNGTGRGNGTGTNGSLCIELKFSQWSDTGKGTRTHI